MYKTNLGNVEHRVNPRTVKPPRQRYEIILPKDSPIGRYNEIIAGSDKSIGDAMEWAKKHRGLEYL